MDCLESTSSDGGGDGSQFLQGTHGKNSVFSDEPEDPLDFFQKSEIGLKQHVEGVFGGQ